MSLQYPDHIASLRVSGNSYIIEFIGVNDGLTNSEQSVTFKTLEEARQFLGTLTAAQKIEVQPNAENPPFENNVGDENFSPSGPVLVGQIPPGDSEEELREFAEECKAANVFFEDGTTITSHEPDPLTTEENQSEGPPTEPEPFPSYPDADNMGEESPKPLPQKFRGAKTNASSKANVDLSGMKPEEESAVLNNPPQLGGVLNSQLREANPKFKKLIGDQVWSGLNNQWLVFTRDRPGNINTGYSAQGHTQAGAIDMVVGRMSPHPKEIDSDGRPVKVGPIFIRETDRDTGLEVVDAARIYMSQKTDIDINFGLAKGYMGNKKTQSGIGIKADAVRVIARSGGIKLVTHTPREINSQGAKNATESAGVEIIAGNDDTNLQPMVLGDNLLEFLLEIVKIISQINGTLSSVTSDLESLNVTLSQHTHCTGDGMPTTPSLDLQIQCIKSLVKLVSVDKYSQFCHNWNNGAVGNTYLGTSNRKSAKSILSRSNRVN